MNTDPNPTPVTAADTPHDHLAGVDRRAEQRRRVRAAAKVDPPEPSPGPNRAQRREFVRNVLLRRRGAVAKGGAAR